VCLVSTAARFAWIAEPCRAPCDTPADHTLVFDESYYVNAARVIAGIRPPPGASYAGAPLGTDPNSEHPQLGKLVIAGSIELLGDGPVAWRLGSIVFGTLAIVGMFHLARAAGGGRWVGLGAASLMATDNLELVHGRIGTLDVYVLAAIVWGAAAYLRGRPVVAGVLIGIGAAFKEVAPYALLVLAVFETLGYLGSRTGARGRAIRVGACTVTAAGVFVGLVAVMDRIAPPYDPQTRKLVGGGPLGHIMRILDYGAGQTSPHGPRGIASYPWEWLFDYKPIVYLYINPSRPGDGLVDVHPAVHFLGVVSPPILVAGLVALVLAGRRRLLRGRLLRGRPAGLPTGGGALARLGLAWVVGTLGPYELLSVVFGRTSYLYYMVIVMPGIYLLVADLIGRYVRDWRILAGWVASVVVAVVVMYPFTPLPS
jgi:Glycosyltransferase family 87